MNRNLTITQWKLHRHHSAQFMKPLPRTSREAFGSDYGHEKNVDAAVVWVVVIAFAVGLLVAA